jgi:WD40 repeat protein
MRTSRDLKCVPALLFLAVLDMACNPSQDKRLDYGNQESLPEHAIVRLGDRRLRHSDSITSLAFSADSAILASGGVDRSICLWETQSGKPLRKLVDLRSRIYKVALSPDGRVLAAGGHDPGSVQLFDAHSGKLLHNPMDKGADVWSLAFTGDSKTLLFGKRNSVVLWGIEEAKEKRALPCEGDVISLAVGSNSTRLAVGTDSGRLTMWDLENFKELFSVQVGGIVRAVDIARTGKWVVSATSSGEVSIWDSQSGKEVRRLEARKGAAFDIAGSCDGKFVVLASQAGLRVWDAETGEVKWEPDLYDEPVWAVSCSPAGSQIAAGTSSGLIRILDLAKQEEVLSPVLVGKLSVDPQGERIASAVRDRVHLWSLANGTLLKEYRLPREGAVALCWQRSGNVLTLVSKRDRATIVMPDSETRTISLKGVRQVVFPAQFSYSGTLLAGAQDQKVSIWRVETGERLHIIEGREGYVSHIHFSPDGSRFIVHRLSGLLELVDVASGQIVWEKKDQVDVSWSSFSADSKLIAVGGTGQSVVVLKISDGSEHMRLHVDRKEYSAGTYSKDGRALLCGTPSGEIDRWNMEEKKKVLVYRGEGAIESIQFTEDGSRFISVGRDGSGLVWRFESANKK